jgi:hypothetical protein
MRSVSRSGSSQPSAGGACAEAPAVTGRLRPNRSGALTHSSETMAEPSDISPRRTVAATTSASLRTLHAP